MMRDTKSYAEAARRAIQAAGGQTALARRLSCLRREKITPGRVQQWGFKGVPAAFVLDVETLTGVSRSQLRPDVFYPDLT